MSTSRAPRASCYSRFSLHVVATINVLLPTVIGMAYAVPSLWTWGVFELASVQVVYSIGAMGYAVNGVPEASIPHKPLYTAPQAWPGVIAKLPELLFAHLVVSCLVGVYLLFLVARLSYAACCASERAEKALVRRTVYLQTWIGGITGLVLLAVLSIAIADVVILVKAWQEHSGVASFWVFELEHAGRLMAAGSIFAAIWLVWFAYVFLSGRRNERRLHLLQIARSRSSSKSSKSSKSRSSSRPEK